MSEEKQEVEIIEPEEAKAEEVKETKVVQPEKTNAEINRENLTAFILSVIAITVCLGWIIGGVAGIVLGALALNMRADTKEPLRHPFRSFRRATKPISIVAICVGSAGVLTYVILFIFDLVRLITRIAN